MKNIHVLPTDKPSRLYLTTHEYIFEEGYSLSTDECENKHIYITSDEKFVRDEYITDGIEVIKATPKLVNAQGLVNRRNWRKVILTTDQDLIKDGVQAIDDEFLEWFVNNPSCEEVEVAKTNKLIDNYADKDEDKWEVKYHIYFPKEEQKQQLIDMMKKDEELGLYDIFNDEKRQGVKELIDKHKQETLEQVAKRILHKNEVEDEDMILSCTFPNTIKSMVEMAKWQKEQFTIEEQYVGHTIDELDKAYIKGFNEGAKYQAEKMYSEEVINEMFDTLKRNAVNNVATITNIDLFISSWKREFKNK